MTERLKGLVAGMPVNGWQSVDLSTEDKKRQAVERVWRLHYERWKEPAAVTVQRAWRLYRARRAPRILLSGRFSRGILRAASAAICIQRTWRGVLGREEYREAWGARVPRIIRVQACVRRWLAQRALRRLRVEARLHEQREAERAAALARADCAARCIQRFSRGWAARLQAKRLQAEAEAESARAAAELQQQQQAAQEAVKLETLRTSAAITLQRFCRGYNARRLYRKLQAEQSQRKTAAIRCTAPPPPSRQAHQRPQARPRTPPPSVPCNISRFRQGPPPAPSPSQSTRRGGSKLRHLPQSTETLDVNRNPASVLSTREPSTKASDTKETATRETATKELAIKEQPIRQPATRYQAPLSSSRDSASSSSSATAVAAASRGAIAGGACTALGPARVPRGGVCTKAGSAPGGSCSATMLAGERRSGSIAASPGGPGPRFSGQASCSFSESSGATGPRLLGRSESQPMAPIRRPSRDLEVLSDMESATKAAAQEPSQSGIRRKQTPLSPLTRAAPELREPSTSNQRRWHIINDNALNGRLVASGSFGRGRPGNVKTRKGAREGLGARAAAADAAEMSRR